MDLARELGLHDDEVEQYGPYKAKISLAGITRLEAEAAAKGKRGKYVVVTAITPTPLGEGKTTTNIGLVQGLNRIGHKAAVCIRQPSLGPVFGIKGGAAGGGYSQVIPMEDFNLHLTGDNHAVGAAHNLLAAFVDNSLTHGNPHGIDPLGVLWPRVVDISDRAIRKVIIGLGGRENGYPRETEWEITVASEVMAILALTSDLQDLRKRLGRTVVATTFDGRRITAEDLKCAGAMTVLLRDAIKPNLLQTLEGGPAFVHCGPFANIAHGNNSVLADRLALATTEIACTEAGFGADMGAEKFFDIKCRESGLRPDAAVMVATVRALKMHGGVGRIVAGKPLDPALEQENVEAVRKGSANLAAQIENVRIFNVPVVVAINHFPTDTEAEVAAIREVALAAGARDVVVSRHFADGGAGAEDLARAVWAAAEEGAPEFRLLYPDDLPLREKIETVAVRIYGARGVDELPAATKALKLYEELGFGNLPVCMAKTHLSLSHDPSLKGRPTGFRVPIREVRLSAGAGFITPLLGEMRTMPGLPSHPAGENIDIDSDGNIVGLF
jgi:formate--tetrahydrofolate ligase